MISLQARVEFSVRRVSNETSTRVTRMGVGGAQLSIFVQPETAPLAAFALPFFLLLCRNSGTPRGRYICMERACRRQAAGRVFDQGSAAMNRDRDRATVGGFLASWKSGTHSLVASASPGSKLWRSCALDWVAASGA